MGPESLGAGLGIFTLPALQVILLLTKAGDPVQGIRGNGGFCGLVREGFALR